MTIGRFCLAVLFVIVGVTRLAGSDIPSPGATKESVITQLGAPTGSMHVGPKEILTYPVGRVILVNGLVKSFEPSEKDDSASDANSPTVQNSPGGSVTVVRATSAHWLSDLDSAKAQAAAENKPILFLLTGDMSRCPWGTQFNQTVQANESFLRMMSTEFVLLRIHFGELPSGGEIGGPTFHKVKAILALREQVFSSIAIPAIAILSADAKRSVEVDISNADSRKGDMFRYMTQAIAAAKTSPMKDSSSLKAVLGKLNFSYIAFGVFIFVLVVKRLTR